MDQYQSTNPAEQSITLCGKCMKEFQGGPGNPFCPECMELMRSQNAFPADPNKPVDDDGTGSSGFRTL